jgi:hypothetical protein
MTSSSYNYKIWKGREIHQIRQSTLTDMMEMRINIFWHPTVGSRYHLPTNGNKISPRGFVSVSWAKLSSSYRSSASSSLCRTQHFDKKTFSIHIFSSRKRDYVTCRCSYIMESKGAQKQLFDVSITRQQLLNSVSMEYCWLCSPPPPNLAVCWCANSTSKLSYSKAIPSESSSW